MPEVKSYKPGTFSWADLSTSDQAGAKKFYSELLGWKTDDVPMGPGATYTMAKVAGQDVAAIAGLRDEEKAQKIPPHWNVYFTVENVDDATQKAGAAGGKVLAPPMDVLDAGRMSVVADPSGAALCLWQAKKHIGAGVLHDTGALDWAELSSTNVDASGSFYAKLFGWSPNAMKMGNMTYTVFRGGSDDRAGMMEMPKEAKGAPSMWYPYFSVANCDQSLKLIEKLKGSAVTPATDVPTVGRFAFVKDPQGALFAIIQPQNRPAK
jgi:predicted enzyme related to lactoylglutathione lyase